MSSRHPTSDDIAPIAQMLDPAYPDTLREMAELLFLELLDSDLVVLEGASLSEEQKRCLARLALKQTERLSAQLGGGYFYLPKGSSFKLTSRNRQMCEEFRGDYRLLARKWKLTEQQVRNIVDAWQNEQFARRQGTLCLEDQTPQNN